jgi:hypothetical protein
MIREEKKDPARENGRMDMRVCNATSLVAEDFAEGGLLSQKAEGGA